MTTYSTSSSATSTRSSAPRMATAPSSVASCPSTRRRDARTACERRDDHTLGHTSSLAERCRSIGAPRRLAVPVIEVTSLTKRYGNRCRRRPHLWRRAPAGSPASSDRTAPSKTDHAPRSARSRRADDRSRDDHGTPVPVARRARRPGGRGPRATGFHPDAVGAEPPASAGGGAGVADSRIEEVLALVKLEQWAHSKVNVLPRNATAAELACALLGDPDVLVLDEPANGLDPEGIRWLRDLLRSLSAQGRTILISSHVLAEIAQTVDDVAIIQKGVSSRTHTRGAHRARRRSRPRADADCRTPA